jgi:hypothetical protein
LAPPKLAQSGPTTWIRGRSQRPAWSLRGLHKLAMTASDRDARPQPVSTQRLMGQVRGSGQPSTTGPGMASAAAPCADQPRDPRSAPGHHCTVIGMHALGFASRPRGRAQSPQRQRSDPRADEETCPSCDDSAILAPSTLAARRSGCGRPDERQD